MATPSLYRRYRPRRFAEVKGQEHVVKALRDSVAQGREGQAYLFSGPRGTGKTTSARILAKVLNCEHPVDGEPCCECASCLDVERGVSYDVHELDAASNNGVEAMRELIEKAQLGTPGRHKVYILDEVHMLSKPAEAALLKTLEEPPSHVVFVLATTDPQKVSDTIRSRTQHLRFHLLAPDTLAEHVRWVAADAGLTLSPEAVDLAVSQGAGSARDTLSALELIANSGGEPGDVLRFDEFVEAFIEHDPGQALTAMAHLVAAGHDPRTIAEELVKHLRNSFLSIMAPDLVQLPSAQVDLLAQQAQRLGAPALVAAVERLGQILIEMRHAPDARVLVEVALVQLTRPSGSSSAAPARTGPPDGVDAGVIGALTDRIAKLEAALAAGVAAASGPLVDPATGRARVGARAERAARTGATAPASSAAPSADPVPAAAEPADTAAEVPADTPADIPSPAAPPTPAGGDPGREWVESVRPSLRGLTRALYAPVEFVAFRDAAVVLQAPNAMHQDKCANDVATVERVWRDTTGRTVRITWEAPDAGGGGGAGGGRGSGGPAPRPRDDAAGPRASEPPQAPPAPSERPTPTAARPATPAERPSGPPPAASPVDDAVVLVDDVDRFDDIDQYELDESRPAIVGAVSAADRLLDAFPGSTRIDPPTSPAPRY